MVSTDKRALDEIAKAMRADCLKMGRAAKNQGIHLGASFSCIEIMAALYFKRGALDPQKVEDEARDRIILSKGHGVPAQYAAFVELGLIDETELETFKQAESRLTGHPSLGSHLDGIEFSTGSLGQGLSLGVGSALALRRKGNQEARVYVIMGDGECDEGSVWEAAMSAAHYGLDNLTAIVDANVLQYDGTTDEVMSLGDLAAKFEAFGWKTIEVDGHDCQAVAAALDVVENGQPIAIIAHTVKGKGASFAEGVVSWHHDRLTDKLFMQAMEELGFDASEEVT